MIITARGAGLKASRGKGFIVEHRCGERLSMILPAIVHKANGEAIGVMLRNLSGGGAFVSMPVDRAILRGLVKLAVHLPGTEPRFCLWRAFVIRQQADGAGLMFDDHQSAERRPFLAAQRSMRQMIGQMIGQRTGEGRVGRAALDL